MKDWQVYLIKCSDSTLYCGVTKDLETRLQKHNQGTASRYTRSRLPVKLAAVRKNLTKEQAFKLEYRIKKLSAKDKILALENNEVGK